MDDDALEVEAVLREERAVLAVLVVEGHDLGLGQLLALH